MSELILASASPRRKELLTQIGLQFEIVVSEAEEVIEKGNTAENAVKKLAYDKANWVAKKYPSKVVLGADTVVVSGSQIMGKPQNDWEAYKMLRALSGTKHKVLTGVAVICKEKGKVIVDHSITDVFFKKLSEEEIHGYIATGEPFDKAGGYGIQGIGSCLVEKIHGCYFNVVGLPIHLVVEILKEFGIKVLGR